MERRRIEWAAVVASFAAAGLVLGFIESPQVFNRVHGQLAAAPSATLSSFTQVQFPSPVLSFQFFGKERVVASLDNGNLECRSLSGTLLWRVNGVGASDLRFTRDGKRVSVWSDENGMRVLDAATGIQTASFQTTSPVTWSANDRYFVAKANDKPVVGDVITGTLRPCTGADDRRTAVSNMGDVYHLANSCITLDTPTRTVQWYGGYNSSDKTPWNYIVQSHFGPAHAVDINADFSNVTTIRTSPDGNTLALGRDNGTLEIVRASALTMAGDYFTTRPLAIHVKTVSSSIPVTWMEWLQEGALAVSYGDDAKEDYCLIDADGTMLASLEDKKEPWISAKGTLTLETRDGRVTARRFLNAASLRGWSLDTPTADTEVPTRIYGENLAAVANGQMVSFYEIPAL